MFAVGSLTGAVDWNLASQFISPTICRRFPHGSRGLKFLSPHDHIAVLSVGSLTGAVDWNTWGKEMLWEYLSRFPHGSRGLKFSSGLTLIIFDKTSVPSREPWIEISSSLNRLSFNIVGSLTGAVDWNILPSLLIIWGTEGRFPHGSRGLKYEPDLNYHWIQ